MCVAASAKPGSWWSRAWSRSVRREAADNDHQSHCGLGTRVDAYKYSRGSVCRQPRRTDRLARRKTAFNNASLAEVAEEAPALSGETADREQLQSGQSAPDQRVQLDNTDALLKALPNILPAAVRTLDDGSQEIISQ